MSHPWVEGIDQSDLIGFYNHFLEKADDGQGVVNHSPISLGGADSASLMVIDMQNDFMLLPPGIGNPPGRFSVGNGLSMSGALANFIRSNAKKFSSIVFTRDTHPIDHCSFFTNGGPFPPHCIINHDGAAMHDSMKEFASLPNAHVVFKGAHSDTDSFGAAQYKEPSYLKKRQLGKCCPGGLCSENTGAFFLTDKSKSWDDYPFDGVGQYPNSNNPVLTSGDCPDAKWENIQDQIGERFTLDHILEQKGGVHYIFVVGLAGDYCVKDTALNLSAEIADKNLSGTVKVVVLQPYVRYACLPLQYVGGNQVYSTNILTNIKSGIFSDISKPKDINHYIFKLGPVTKLLSKEEAVAAANNISAISPANNSSNPNVYGSFLTPTKDIVRDYNASGVTIAMEDPMLSMVGGRRRTARRRGSRKSTKKYRR